MVFNPLKKVENSRNTRQIPQKIYQLIIDRFHVITEGIERVEKASGLKYPYYYVEPNLVISSSQAEFAQFGIFFARTIPVISKDKRLNVVIQITAPLIAYSLLGTAHAILAHEFMHYLEMVSRIMKMKMISDEISGTMFERRYVDTDHLLEARAVFKSDRALIDHITKRFPDGFRDLRLEEKVIKEWINKGLPTTSIPVDANMIKIPIELMAELEVDKVVKEKIIEFESRKLRNKKFRDYV